MPPGSSPPTFPLRSTTIRDTPLDLNRSTAAFTSPAVFELNDLIRTTWLVKVRQKMWVDGWVVVPSTLGTILHTAWRILF